MVNYSIIPNEASASRFSVSVNIACTAWPTPAITMLTSRVNEASWNTVGGELVVRLETNITRASDPAGAFTKTIVFKIDYTKNYRDYKLKFVCKNEYGDITSNEIKFPGMT